MKILLALLVCCFCLTSVYSAKEDEKCEDTLDKTAVTCEAAQAAWKLIETQKAMIKDEYISKVKSDNHNKTKLKILKLI
jgi:hypothetical protein